MIRTYVFGCHEQIDGLRTFTVNLNMSGPPLSETEAKQKAMDAAVDVARAENLANPTLIFEVGLPEIKVINDHVNDETITIYSRNSELPPCVSVIDIDHTPDPKTAVEERERVIAQLAYGGFDRVPHFIE